MTEKRFGYGAGVNWQEDVIIDYETEKSYDFYEVGKLLNKLHEDNEELSVMKSKGLKVLEFYEYKLKNADRKEFENAREELWIVKEVLSEMGVIKDD